MERPVWSGPCGAARVERRRTCQRLQNQTAKSCCWRASCRQNHGLQADAHRSTINSERLQACQGTILVKVHVAVYDNDLGFNKMSGQCRLPPMRRVGDCMCCVCLYVRAREQVFVCYTTGERERRKKPTMKNDI